ncbi:MAG TPA: hypothetical protein VNA20_09275 [Frankiaceae bacterium]|nr:hypothetical protein [Frankiaceae bacterium]
MIDANVVEVEPQRGDGRLTLLDVQSAVERLPRDAAVVVRYVECDDFDPAAPGWLARELCGSVVVQRFEPTAWRISAHWRELYDRAAAEYLAIEAAELHRRA